MSFTNLIVVAGIISLRATAAEINITGELKQWHKVTLTVDGPFAQESNSVPNPFLDYRMTVTFIHESGSPLYRVPGYFAADGNAAQTSATAGNKWRAHLSPDKPGRWNYEVSLLAGKHVAVDDEVAHQASPVLHATGSFDIAPTDKSGRDFRGKGRLQYAGKRYLQFAGSKEFFLKAGADSPENLLAYMDFDGTYSAKAAGITRDNEATTSPLKTWQPHVRDWRPGDPTWKGGKGKGLIGALNYLAGKGCNAISFLTYNAGGDGDDVWPFVSRDDRLHYDCPKLDQWQIVFDHAQQLGLYLHFKLQETENDDNRSGDRTNVPAALDGGELGLERKLYYFGYTLPQNDLGCEDWRSRDRSWDYCRIALDFFRDNKIPFWEMQNADTLVGNEQNDNSKYCFAHPGKVYVVYLPNGGSAGLDLSDDTATFRVQWFNPREGGPLQSGSITEVKGPGVVLLGPPPAEADQDWVVLIRK